MENKSFPPSTDDDAWFVLRTRSRYEKKLSENLTKQGIRTYLPTKIERRQWSDRMKKVEVPLFGGYLFVQMQEANRYQILNTPGAVNFVYFSGKYAQLTRKDIEMIHLALDDTQELEVLDTELYPGKAVKITSGPFKGFEAKLIHHNGKGKLVLEVKAIAQGVVIELSKTKIKPILTSDSTNA